MSFSLNLKKNVFNLSLISMAIITFVLAFKHVHSWEVEIDHTQDEVVLGEVPEEDIPTDYHYDNDSGCLVPD